MNSVAVFCGANPGNEPWFAEAATELGKTLAQRKIRVLFGGGSVGLMGILADAVLAGGGHVIGVIPKALATKELAHTGLSDLRIVGTMHERKALMADLAGGFVAMPGGLGTFEEFCEVLTWAQLGIHAKPCGILNVDGYYDPLLALLDHAVEERFVRPQHRSLVLASAEPALLLDAMEAFRAPPLEKWIDRETT